MSPDARAWLVGGGVALVAAAGVARLEGGLVAKAHAAKEQTDVTVLPPPATLKVVSLGYNAAFADALWAKILVEYGTHWGEHRPFPALEQYIDGILALEPDFPTLYRYVDTLLVYRPPRGTEADARRARAYLEFGLTARPNDHDLWLRYGQFLEYIAPSFLQSDADKEAWRTDGAHAILRAVDLGADADRALSSVHQLTRAGESNAVIIASLRTAYAVTDDAAEREEIMARLSMLEAHAEQEAAAVAAKLVEARWRDELPFVVRTDFLLMGPSVDPLRCAGLDPPSGCERDWGPWVEQASAADSPMAP